MQFKENIGNATNSYGYAWFGDGTTGGFETYIDDVSLWSKKLFPNDVKFLYDKGKMKLLILYLNTFNCFCHFSICSASCLLNAKHGCLQIELGDNHD